MYESLRKLYLEFSKQEKRKLQFIALIIIVTALIQVVGIASIFPFISVASDPSVVDQNVHLLAVKTYFGIEENRQFILVLGGLVLLTLILTNMFLAFSTWITLHFVVTIIQTLSIRMLERYLNEDYVFHLKRNSAELLKNLTSEIGRVVNGGIMSAINIASKGFTALCIIAFLILVDPVIALIVATVLGLSYVLIYWSIRLKLARIGIIVTQLFSDRMRYINESLNGIKELKVLGRENYYLKHFRANSKEIMKHQVFNRAAIDLPKYLLETVAFGGILAMTMYLVAVKDDTQTILPMISLYGLAGYRLMPALQGLFHSTATLKHDIAAVDLFYEDIRTDNIAFNYVEDETDIKKPLHLNESLSLNNICFHYPGASKHAVTDLSLSVNANSSIGIVGTSGSGKSTLVDIILGLLHAQQGTLAVDGQILTKKNIRAWQNNIGYVPQVIFLADSTVSENIAFGIARNEIDQSAVEKAARMANLHDFIVNDLEEGYQTIVGERGIRLSGGQRQRIGIARALYHDPDILILDEATSALDSPTERSIIESVYKLAYRKTIIMIAHRLSTIKECDKIIIMEKGKIVDSDTYEELSKSSPYFRKLLLKDH
jgi:ATP-binding cassette, subfamily B, bacterial PglK